MKNRTQFMLGVGVFGLLIWRNIYLMKDRDYWKGIATRLDSGDPKDPNNPNNPANQ